MSCKNDEILPAVTAAAAIVGISTLVLPTDILLWVCLVVVLLCVVYVAPFFLPFRRR